MSYIKDHTKSKGVKGIRDDSKDLPTLYFVNKIGLGLGGKIKQFDKDCWNLKPPIQQVNMQKKKHYIFSLLA